MRAVETDPAKLVRRDHGDVRFERLWIINSTYLYLKSSNKLPHNMDFSHQNTHLPKVVWGPSRLFGSGPSF